MSFVKLKSFRAAVGCVLVAGLGMTLVDLDKNDACRELFENYRGDDNARIREAWD